MREAPTVESAFFVHKELLASLSPELEKHVKNDMREGREGEMQLGEVEEGTIKAFLYWVYKDDYYSYVIMPCLLTSLELESLYSCFM